MEAKLESLTISDKPLSSQTIISDAEEDSILAYIQNGGKKVELNVNAKEFVPRFSIEIPSQNTESGQTNSEQTFTPRTLLSAKNGDENYKPIFMNGMTEKFIQGPYMGNGRDAEIPYVRYFSNNQAIDFFNKKYFVNGNSGEIMFKPHETNEQNQEQYTGPLFANGFSDNIFKPPFINALVSDILYRQYLSALWPKTSPLFIPPRRGSGKRQTNNGSFSYGQRSFTRSEAARTAKIDKGSTKFPPTNGSQEEWLEEEISYSETPNVHVPNNIIEPEFHDKCKNSVSSGDQEIAGSNNTNKSITIESPRDDETNGKGLKKELEKDSPKKCSFDNDEDILKRNGCSITDKSKELLTERQSPFLESIARRESLIPAGNKSDSSRSDQCGSEPFSDDSSNLSDHRAEDILNPTIDITKEDTFFENAHNTAHS